MPGIVGDYDSRAALPSDLRNVSVMDSAPRHPVLHRVAQQAQASVLSELRHFETTQDL